MTEDEKLVLQEACSLIARGTSNSLSPDIRRQWNDDRDRLLARLREIAR
jgi:hypothetical protein